LNFHAWQWFLAALGALLVGLAKTGISGLSLLFVGIFASIMPARRSTGVVLPLLLLGDVIAFLSFRRFVKWVHVLRLFPWAAAGVIAGYFSMGRMNDRQAGVAIGSIVAGLALLYLALRAHPEPPSEARVRLFVPLLGMLVGFTTIVSNAGGPIMVIYLLAMRLSKMEYMGTMAAFFFVLDLFKLPFMIKLGLITPVGLTLNLALAPLVIAGTILGRWLLGRINQRVFENIVLALALAAAAKMFF